MENGPAENELEISPFFAGSIAEAIKVTKLERRILIVYIAGENEDCCKMDQTTWKDYKVQKVIRERFVTLRLLQSSSDAAHFFAMYRYHEVPSISVICDSGMLLKQIGGHVPPEELLGMLEQSIAVQNAATIVAALASANTGSTAFPTQNQANSTSIVSETLQSQEGGFSAMHDGSEACSPSAAPSDEKLFVGDDTSQLGLDSTEMNDGDAASEALEQERETLLPKQAAVAKFETSEGKTEQVLDSTPCDVSLDETTSQNVAASRDSETESDKRIANMDVLPSLELKASSSRQEEAPRIRQVAETFLIQVRLTNGKSIRKSFIPKDSLALVKEFVDQNRDDGNDVYSLAMLYPRKNFSKKDMEKSLLELGLEDRATLALVTSPAQPKFRGSESSSVLGATPEVMDSGSNGGIWKIFSYLNPLSYFSGSSNGSNNAEPGSSSWQYEPNPNLRESFRHGTEGNGLSNPNVNETNASNRKKAPERNWGGNIHTLQHNDNDEAFKRGNTFWNGNSTQFGGEDSQK